MGKPRKRHSSEAGYIAERMNPFVPDTKVVIYRAAEQGLELHGRHHEIYLSDPRRVPPERLKTILRHPVRKKEKAGPPCENT